MKHVIPSHLMDSKLFAFRELKRAEGRLKADYDDGVY